jgi:two-component system, NarL family, invasion response regulator UvrY
MSRIMIVDDHAMVRAGLRQFLLEDSHPHDVVEASCGTQALDLLRASRFDLLLLDISMPSRGGMDILKHIHCGFPDTRVLIVSGFPERQYAFNVLKAGARGYLSKDSAPEDLLAAVHAVLAGRRYLSTSLTDLLVDRLDMDSDKPLHSLLSQREFQIFCKLSAGRRVSEIAEELSLSVKTVSTYRSRVFDKMQFHSNADITSYAMRNGLMQ